jgi:thioredoxin reductase (NADPH)
VRPRHGFDAALVRAFDFAPRKAGMLSGVACVYGGAMAAIWGGYLAVRARRRQRDLAVRGRAERDGLLDPPTRHPAIDARRCFGCGACATACPEGEVLGVIDDKAVLLNPSGCVGHSACVAACPADAIRLVYGTAERGVDVPWLDTDLETNVPGIFIAGELGGVGLIANAVDQGRRAMAAIDARRGAAADDEMFDVVIAGAGPAGLSASLAAIERGLRFVTIEQQALGGCIANHPGGKLVLSSPVDLPLVGRMPFREASKLEVLEHWREVERRVGLEVRYGEHLSTVSRRDGAFDVVTSGLAYRTRSVLLAIGRRGAPRRLGVPGEQLPKVRYGLANTAQYHRRRVAVIGGGDSALEAASSLAAFGDVEVTLVHRGLAFSRARQINRDQIAADSRAGRIDVRTEATVTTIEGDTVTIRHRGAEEVLANDFVIVCAGGTVPTALLEHIGIAVETKHGTA